MQICPQCHRETEDGHRFCGACGFQLNNNCPDCGFDNLPNQEFCGQCGQQILDISTPSEMSSEVNTSSAQETEPVNPLNAIEDFDGMEIKLPSLDDIEMSSSTESFPSQEAAILSLNDDIVDIMPPSLDELQKEEPEAQIETQAYTLPSHSEAFDEMPSGMIGILIEILQPPEFEQAVNDAGISDDDLLIAFTQLQDHAGSYLSELGFEVFLADHDIIRGQLNITEKDLDADTLAKLIENMSHFCQFPHQIMDIPVQLKAGIAYSESNETSEGQIAGFDECAAAEATQVAFNKEIAMLLEPLFSINLIQTQTKDGKRIEAYQFSSVESPINTNQVEALENIHEVEQPMLIDLDSSDLSNQAESFNHEELMEEDTERDENLNENPSSSSVSSPVASLRSSESLQFEPIHFEPERYIITSEKAPSNTNYETAVASLFDEFQAITSPDATGKIIQLMADDGVGKSYILNIARSLVEPETSQSIIWLGSHHYQSFASKQLPLMLWHQLFLNTMGLIPEGHGIDDVQSQISAFLNYVCQGQISTEMQQVLHDLLSVSPIEGISQSSSELEGRLEAFLFDLLTLMSSNQPVIIILDNIQYADQPSLGILCRLLKRDILSKRILIVMTQTRECLPCGDCEAALSKIEPQRISIANLSRSEMDKFLNDGPFGGQIEQYPLAFLETLYQRSKGNPLYLEEAIRWLHLEDYLITDEKTGKFTVDNPEHLLEAALPDKVEALISKRVEILEDESRYLLQLASVLGECFSIRMLQSLSQQEQTVFNDCLTHLFNHGLIQPDATNTGRFRHGQIWKVVYQNIAPSLRQQFHQLISETLEEDVKNHMTVTPFIRAYHAISGQLINRAIHYLARTGAQAAMLGCTEAANLALINAVDYFQHLPVDKIEVSHSKLYTAMLEDIALLNLRSHPDLSITVLNILTGLFQETQPAMMLETLGLLSSAYENKGVYYEALSISDDMLTLLNQSQYPVEYVLVQISKLEQLYHLGRFQEGIDLFLNEIDPVILPKLHQLTEPQAYLYFKARLITAKMLNGQLDERGLKWLDQTLANETHLLKPDLKLSYRLARGTAWILSGRYKQCDKEAELLLSDIEKLDNPDWHLAQWGLLALEFHAAKGDWQNAKDILLTILDKANEAGDYLTAITAEAWGGYLQYQFNNDPVGALKALNDAIHKSSEYRFASTALLGWQFMSTIHLELGHLDEAENLIENAIDVAKKEIYNQKHRLFELTLLKARLIIARQNKDTTPEAGKLLETLWPEVVQTKSAPMIAQTAEAIGELYKTLAHQVSEKARKKHLMRSVQFYQKANGIWLDLENQYHLRRVQERTPRI